MASETEPGDVIVIVDETPEKEAEQWVPRMEAIGSAPARQLIFDRGQWCRQPPRKCHVTIYISR
jgi:hypothetical protein